MIRETITVNDLSTICWSNNELVDWVSAGYSYSPGKTLKQKSQCHYGDFFDSSIASSNGQYAFIYQRLGTKGLLLKDGNLLREINRSYYCADVYEYPAAFVIIGSETYLIHCPLKYCRLDFENVETGALITDIPERDPGDVFHSRLETSSSNKFLICKSWVWHPLDVVELFDIEACLQNPHLLDQQHSAPYFGAEICTASFIDDSRILIGSGDDVYDDEDPKLPPKHIATWNFQTNELTNPIKVKAEFGNLFAINEVYAWDTFKYPKIINIQTGEVVDDDDSIFSGEQNSSIIHCLKNPPKIIFNNQTKQLAIASDKKIEVLTPSKALLS